jgi:tetratricopeptide (TPR) repeat protein
MADDINIGIQAFMENNLRLAYDMFADIKANGPGDFDLPDHFLAGIYYKSGQFDMAIKHCRSALKINPSSVGALLTLNEIYRRIGEPEQADAAMDSVLSICPWLAGY